MKAIYWIAKNTFLEAVRQKFFNFLLLLGLIMTSISVGMASFDFGNSELKFIADFGFGGLFLFGSILAVIMSVQLFFAELDNRTALTLLSKPVGRGAFILGKFFGIWALLGVFTGIMVALLMCVFIFRQPILAEIALRSGSPEPFLSVSGLWAFAGLQWVRLGIVAGMSLVITSFAQTYLYAIVVSFCGLLIAQLQYVLQDVLLSQKVGEFFKWGALVITKLVPNLQMFNLGPQLTLEANAISAGTLCSIFAYGGIWILALLAIAVWFFRNREM